MNADFSSQLALSAENIPAYLAWLAVMVILIALFTFLYKLVTPYRELELIRAGNRAAAFSLGGTVIGFAIALHTIASGSGSLLEMLMWGVIALLCQVGVFLVAARLLGDLKAGIEADREGYGIFLGALSIAMGTVNAGALTY
ncbi:MAG TPA: DUF350 domain-containing protein [Azospirillaceae bacterium]|nr:DUF350 domain-containing protein [Azospirillaceae bacterium]